VAGKQTSVTFTQRQCVILSMLDRETHDLALNSPAWRKAVRAFGLPPTHLSVHRVLAYGAKNTSGLRLELYPKASGGFKTFETARFLRLRQLCERGIVLATEIDNLPLRRAFKRRARVLAEPAGVTAIDRLADLVDGSAG